MGFFDGIKKFANEMVDDEICPLGENAQRRELKNRIAKQLKQKKIPNASTKKIEHKKIDNLREVFNVDYRDLLFFVDTTMMRNNGTLGIGAIDEWVFWKFNDEQRLAMPLNDLLLGYTSDDKLVLVKFENEQLVFNSLPIGDKAEMFEAVITALNKEQNAVMAYQNMLEPLVERDLTINDAFRVDLLKVLSPAQHVRLEKLLIEKAITENDPTFWSYAVHQLSSHDSDEFETFRGKILEHTVSLLQEDLPKEKINEYLDIVNEFDIDGKYTTLKLECMLNLDRVTEAKMLAYKELPEAEREEFLTKQEQKEKELRLKIEQAIDKGEDIFEDNPQYVYTYLTGGLLPAEYAVTVGQSVEYVDGIISKMEHGTQIINRYQFTLNELAAKNHRFNYFAEINHEELPTEGSWAKINKFILGYDTIELQRKIDYGIAKVDEVKSYVRQYEEVRLEDEQLAEDQRKWREQMNKALKENYTTFYMKMLDPVKAEYIHKKLMIIYLGDELEGNDIEDLDRYVAKVSAKNDDLLNELVKDKYAKSPLVRGEFERAEDFDKRVADRIEELKNEFQGRLSLEENHLDNKISKLDAADKLATREMQQLMSDDRVAKLNVLLFMDQLKNIKIKQYDPDEFKFKYIYDNGRKGFLEVPIEVAPKFRDNFKPEKCSDVAVILDEDNAGKPLAVTKYRFMDEEYYFRVCYM